MAYTTLEISQIESIMTEEEKALYTMLSEQRKSLHDLRWSLFDDDLKEICNESGKDISKKILELLALVEQRISLESRLTFSQLGSLWCKDNVEYTGIAYEVHKNGMIEFYTDLSEAIYRQKTEQGITAYKIVEGDEMYAIPNSVLEYAKEDKTYKYDIGWGETLVFNLGSKIPFAIAINDNGDLVYTYIDTMFEVSQLIKDLYPKPVEVLGIQCTILEKSL